MKIVHEATESLFSMNTHSRYPPNVESESTTRPSIAVKTDLTLEIEIISGQGLTLTDIALLKLAQGLWRMPRLKLLHSSSSHEMELDSQRFEMSPDVLVLFFHPIL